MRLLSSKKGKTHKGCNPGPVLSIHSALIDGTRTFFALCYAWLPPVQGMCLQIPKYIYLQTVQPELGTRSVETIKR
jgi:hypothetical protein